jgi:hypothetical protein
MAYKVEIISLDSLKNNNSENASIVIKQDANAEKNAEVLKSVVHKQNMYKPSSLEIKLSTTRGIDVFRGNLITLSDDNDNVYAKRYYIKSVRKTPEYVTLTAYSPDYLLTIDKFCQAFTAKTLVGDIITNTITNISSNNFENYRTIVKDEKITNYIQKNVTNFCDTETQEIEENGVKKTITNYIETVIPYAVQFNESFYDFMVRMCNRDGEFLYLDENNILQVGLDTTKKCSLELDENTVDSIGMSDEEDEGNWVDKDYLGAISDDVVVTENTCVTSIGVLAPEFLETIPNNDKVEYCNWGDYTCAFSEVTTVFRAFAMERTIKDSLLSSLKTIAENDAHYGCFANDTNNNFNSVFPKGSFLFSSNNKQETSRRDNKGYKDVFKNEALAKANQLEVTISQNAYVSLGSIVSYNESDYVVYKIEKTIGDIQASDYKDTYNLLLVKIVENKFYPLPILDNRVKLASAQRAIVVDNFDPSRLGRVRIRYPWQSGEVSDDDRKNFSNVNAKNASPYIRVSTPMASDGAGLLFTPAVGDEVLVDYEDGNIERPYVCGSFYNSTHKPSVASQSQTHGKVKSITSANGHHISFTDTGGAERYISSLMPATKLISSFGVADKLVFDGSDTKHFGGGFEISDYYGIYSITGSTHNRSINISSPFGKVNIDAFQGISIEAPLGDVKIVGKNVSIEARNNLTLTSGTNIPGYFKNKENKNFLYDFAGAVAGSIVDLTFIRTYIEVLLRPIGGTMLLKSNRYMCLEAGEGETQLYRDRKSAKSFILSTNTDTLEQELTKIKENVISTVDHYYQMHDLLKSIIQLKHSLYTSQLKDTFNKILKGDKVISEDELTKILQRLRLEDQAPIYYIHFKASRIKFIYDNYLNKVDFKDSTFKDGLKRFWSGFKSVMNDINEYSYPIKMTKKEILYKEIISFVKKESKLKEKIEMDSWTDDWLFGFNVETAIREKPDATPTIFSKFKSTMLDSLGLKGFVQLADDRCWTEKDNGAILMSNSKNDTFKLTADGNMEKCMPNDYKTYIIDMFENVVDD